MSHDIPASQPPLIDSPEPATSAAMEPIGPDGAVESAMPDDLTYFNPLHSFGQDLDFDMTWALDFDAFSFPQLEFPGPSPTSSTANLRTPGKGALRDASRGHAAFKRSPWLWEPEQEDYVRQEKEGLHVDEQSLPQLSGFGRVLNRPANNLKLNSHQRDRIFSIVLAENKDPANVPSFPTLELLNYVLQANFARDDYQLDSWIHAPSFDPETTMPELLAAIVASGAMLFHVPAVWQFGLALQEVTRQALRNAVCFSFTFFGLPRLSI